MLFSQQDRKATIYRAVMVCRPFHWGRLEFLPHRLLQRELR